MPEFFRMFIALPVPQPVKDEMRRLQHELQKELPEDAVRWTKPEQIHLTLKFLGNIAAENVTELAEAVREACEGSGPTALRAEGVSFFPLKGGPRVIWVAVRGEGNALIELQRAVDSATVRFTDQAAEPDYKGHLTIGRARNLKPSHGRRLRELAARLGTRVFGQWNAGTVEIMRSELSAQGSVHTCIATIPLVGGE